MKSDNSIFYYKIKQSKNQEQGVNLINFIPVYLDWKAKGRNSRGNYNGGVGRGGNLRVG